MSKNEMDEKLEKIFTNTNEWLKYAEAKSVAMIAGNGALIFGISRTINALEPNLPIKIVLIIAICFCAASLIVCLLSVVPSLDMPWHSKPNNPKKSDNLFFFGDIAKYSPQAYLKLLASKSDYKKNDFNEYQKDLAHQVITNAVIAKSKYQYFKVAAWLTLSGLITPLAAAVLWFCRKK